MKRSLIVFLGLYLLASCGSQNTKDVPSTPVREAQDAPVSFSGTFEEVAENTPCQSRLIDPADDTELILVATFDGSGDYQVPLGKYGLSADELLRINCRTGEVIGVVKK